ncbi:MAG TPA: helix-turn-helix domain-containing protein [Mycobacteriales bacterium]|nr:helix-turn-helix domain-containing protein [Mycobacteriales bacterium]
MPRVSQDHLDARRREILDGARRCFAHNGYEGATVRLLESETGLSRGAIFHHFRDKESLFLAVAEDDAVEMAAVVAEHGLVQVMRDLRGRDSAWLSTQLEVARRMRTDPVFRERWQARARTLSTAARERLERGRDNGVVRSDVDVDVLVSFLSLLLDGLVLHRAMELPTEHLDAVLDLVESAVRRP